MKSNSGILTEKEIQLRTKFWNKKQFRTWSNKELEVTSTDMQKLLVAIKEFSKDEIKDIRDSDVDNFRAYVGGFRAHGKDDPKCIICMAGQKDLDYAISIAPKTFKVKQG
ncbi:hypothetical protein BX788P2_00018 [Bacteroides phage BX788P2]|nr:hypothetical protein BX788P2_00018 [Bacteroides phage BX788P2]